MLQYYDDDEFYAAVQSCWSGRQEAASRQLAEGLVRDVGLRAGATSGKHLDAMAALIGKIFLKAGMPADSLFFNSRVEVPGFYRAEKQWDLLVVLDDTLVAAVEFKSILGSYGKNLNNRTEEAIGNSEDLLRAFEEGLLGNNTRAPWLGYVFIIQDEPASRRAVQVREPHFSVDPVFQGASYQGRAELLCRRLVQKRLYDACSYIRSDGSAPEAVEEPAADLTFAKFAAGIYGRVGEVLA